MILTPWLQGNFKELELYLHFYVFRRPNARAALLLVHAFLQMGFGVIFVVKKFYDDKKNTLNPYVLKVDFKNLFN